jgi:hypothetical protein
MRKRDSDFSDIVFLVAYPSNLQPCKGDTMTLEERKALIHFRDEEIPDMSEEEICRRLDALREIEDAPHFYWRLPPKDEKHRELIRRVEEETLNGGASSFIYLLEQELLRGAFL